MRQRQTGAAVVFPHAALPMALARLGRQSSTRYVACRAGNIAGHQFGVWAGQLGDGRAVFCWVNGSRRMARPSTGI